MIEVGDLVTHLTLSVNQEVFGYPKLQGIVTKVASKPLGESPLGTEPQAQVFWYNNSATIDIDEWFLSTSLTKLS